MAARSDNDVTAVGFRIAALDVDARTRRPDTHSRMLKQQVPPRAACSRTSRYRHVRDSCLKLREGFFAPAPWIDIEHNDSGFTAYCHSDICLWPTPPETPHLV